MKKFVSVTAGVDRGRESGRHADRSIDPNAAERRLLTLFKGPLDASQLLISNYGRESCLCCSDSRHLTESMAENRRGRESSRSIDPESAEEPPPTLLA